MHPFISPNIISMHRYHIFFTILLISINIKYSFIYQYPSFQTRTNFIKHTEIHTLETKISTYLTSTKHKASKSKSFNYSYLYQSIELAGLTSFNQKFSLLPFLENKASRSYLFSSDPISFLQIEILYLAWSFHNFMINIFTELLIS
jgi:hypothetical protein